ncbi:hypothetical protein F5141DRAFT_1191198 [Pisolithus sp. B1]|nr:hypothetical protein F5141DRAFT_1191198 [Pisolithus sp. B1]
MLGQAGTPPYANHEHLYSTIDAISEGDAPWTSFSMESAEAGSLAGGPSWKHSGTYEVVFCDPQVLLNHQLSDPGFKNHIDYSPLSIFGEKGQCVWSDFMTGNWAWNQCDPDNHGAMFIPIIGSDKTMVSVATGNNEYYPLYISAGNVHNGMRHAHGEAVSLLGFLSIPKSKCTAHQTHLDNDPNAILCNHEYTQLLMDSFASHVLWQKYGIVDDILPFTASFPHANIHELIAPDILHQIIKGTFKDYLVSWVETYLKKSYKNDFAAVLADIDHCSCGFKQWTGNDSKALMKVYLPAIAGYVPNEMLQALSAFMDFCYTVCQSSLAIELFGAPNGLSTSIVESKHIHAIKRPYHHFSGLLDEPLIPQDNEHEDTSFQDDPYLQEAEDDDGERKSFIFYIAPRKLRTLAGMGQDIGHPELPDLVSIFLFQQRNPGVDVPDISKCPKTIDPGYSFSSAVATFYAPSDFSGAKWNSSPINDPTLPGFQGLHVAQEWFTPVGNEPCISTGMWKVEHEYDEYGDHLYIPPDLHYSDSLAAFGSFYVNKYSDYHAFGLAF